MCLLAWSNDRFQANDGHLSQPPFKSASGREQAISAGAIWGRFSAPSRHGNPLADSMSRVRRAVKRRLRPLVGQPL